MSSRKLSCLVLLAALAVLPGCVAVAAGAVAGSAMAYHTGAMVVSVDATPKSTIDAARRTVEDMDLALISMSSTELDAELVARTASDTRIAITAKRQTPETSELSIRVGLFGDEALSLALYEGITGRL